MDTGLKEDNQLDVIFYLHLPEMVDQVVHDILHGWRDVVKRDGCVTAACRPIFLNKS